MANTIMCGINYIFIPIYNLQTLYDKNHLNDKVTKYEMELMHISGEDKKYFINKCKLKYNS